MRFRSLQTGFVLAGCLFVLATVVSAVWSAFTFARLAAVVDATLGRSQETVDLTTALAGSLEREDDALLLAISGDARQARVDLAVQRSQFETALSRLLPLLSDAAEQSAASELRKHADAYRVAGDALLPLTGQEARRWYNEQVNPALRRAVGDCTQLREISLRGIQQAGVDARDEAWRSTGVVALVSVAALGLSTLVAAGLGRWVIRPVRTLSASVEALRQGDFDSRVPIAGPEELSQLAQGFNRMAATLAEYRSSSLGELLLAKTTLEATLNALPDAVLVIDPDGDIVTANPTANLLFPALVDGKATRLDHLPLQPELRQTVAEALQGRSRVAGRTKFDAALAVTVDGKPRRFLLTAVPVPAFAMRRNGAVIVLEDVTDFVHLDELRTELIAVASHELKTPLTSLRMNLLLLGERGDNLTSPQHELLDAAAGGCEELGNTIDELLDLTRIEAGQLRLFRAPVDLCALIGKVARTLRLRFDDAEITLRIQCDVEPAVIQGDAARLGIVVSNLLGNALKYTPAGGQVSVRVGAASDNRRRFQLTVTDTGPGIPAEFRQRVFDKFFRVEHERPASPEGVRGSGIGLYLCRQIVELHGGSIHCEPGASGRGTQIVVELG